MQKSDYYAWYGLKHFQIVKLELEAVLKLERWDELDVVFEQCWKYKSAEHYETLADLVLVIQSCMSRTNVDAIYHKSKVSTISSRLHLLNQGARSFIGTV